MWLEPFSLCSSHFFDSGDVSLQSRGGLNQIDSGTFPIKEWAISDEALESETSKLW